MSKQLKYFIHNYGVEGAAVADEHVGGLGKTENLAFESWKSRTQDLTHDMTIIEWTTFRTPLQTLGSMGEYFMQLSSISPFFIFASFFSLLASLILPFVSFLFDITFSASDLCIVIAGIFSLSVLCARCYHSFGHNLRIQHSFIVFNLVGGEKALYISLEKLRKGILFQTARNFETVKNFAKGQWRGLVEEIGSSSKLGFEGALFNIAPIDLILGSEDLFDAYYNLLFNNCQQTVSKLLFCLRDKSCKLTFQIPGSEETIAINDERAVLFVQKLHPKWARGQLQNFPDIQNPFAIVVKDLPEPERSDYQLLLMKQTVITALEETLKESNLAHYQGQKAIFSKLNREFLKDSLKKTELDTHCLGSVIIEKIAALWNSVLDIVAVIENIGVVIFYFLDDTCAQSHDHIKEVLTKLELASMIESQFSIHAVSVFKGQCESYLGEIRKSQYGLIMNLTIGSKTLESGLKSLLQECLDKLADASMSEARSGGILKPLSFFTMKWFAPKTTAKPQLEKFSAKLFLLQNMENKDFLIHDRLVKQQFGPDGFVVWTPDQHQLILEARKSFCTKDQKKMRWIIQGCPGSGKTLLLMQMAKEFVESSDEGNVFILILKEKERLTTLLREHVESIGWTNRIFVGHEIDSVKYAKLVLFDEFWFHPEGIRQFQAEFLKKVSTINVALFTSRDKEAIHPNYFPSGSCMGDADVKLLKGNLRSSQGISEIAKEFQQLLDQNSFSAGEKVVSYLEWNSSQPQITLVDDNSNNRQKFLRCCQDHITNLAKRKKDIVVSHFMHASLTEKLQEFFKLQQNVSFAWRTPILGCQYQCIVIIMDVATCFPPMKYLVDVMTRATTCLHLVINTALKPIYIDSSPSFRFEVCLESNLESKVRALMADVPTLQKKVFIFDEEEVLRDSFIKEIAEQAFTVAGVLSRPDLWGDMSKFSLVIEIRTTFGGMTPHLCSRNPCFDIMVVANQDSRRGDAKYGDSGNQEGRSGAGGDSSAVDNRQLAHFAKVYDVVGLNEQIIKFFMSYGAQRIDI